MPQTFTHVKPILSRQWLAMIGSPSAFDLQSRIFHSISLGIVIVATCYLPYNLFAGLYIAALSCIVLASIFYFEYYRSRFLGRSHRSVVFGTIGIIVLSLNYFANAGIEGSTDLIWPVYLLFLLTICPHRYIIPWTIIYLIAFAFVHIAEFYRPEMVQYPFRGGKERFIDRISAFPMPVVGIAIIIGTFRRNYERERTIVAQRDAEKSRLLSILAHDLRTPFVQVQQYLDMLDNDLLSAEERTQMQQALKKKNEQTLLLVTNMLYWSKSQLEGFRVQLVKQHLAATLKNTVEIANGTARDKEIVLRSDIAEEIYVLADVDMLQLVIRNLLQNAIKFSSPGGTINVSAHIEQQRCYISIADQGVGIPPNQMKDLFCGTSSTTGTNNERGVGLGLQLCREFIDLQGGSIDAKSELNRGSIFTISLAIA